jgi:DNA excision repair protein ERCC-8
MNSLLLNRAQGSMSPLAFQVAHTSRLVQLLEPAPGIRFADRHVSSSVEGAGYRIPESVPRAVSVDEMLAHRAGVNVLAIDQHEGR